MNIFPKFKDFLVMAEEMVLSFAVLRLLDLMAVTQVRDRAVALKALENDLKLLFIGPFTVFHASFFLPAKALWRVAFPGAQILRYLDLNRTRSSILYLSVTFFLFTPIRFLDAVKQKLLK